MDLNNRMCRARDTDFLSIARLRNKLDAEIDRGNPNLDLRLRPDWSVVAESPDKRIICSQGPQPLAPARILDLAV